MVTCLGCQPTSLLEMFFEAFQNQIVRMLLGTNVILGEMLHIHIRLVTRKLVGESEYGLNSRVSKLIIGFWGETSGLTSMNAYCICKHYHVYREILLKEFTV